MDGRGRDLRFDFPMIRETRLTAKSASLSGSRDGIRRDFVAVAVQDTLSSVGTPPPPKPPPSPFPSFLVPTPCVDYLQQESPKAQFVSASHS